MALKTRFLGGCREVGRSAILINDVLLDYGIKPTEPVQYPLNGLRPTDIIISHGHLDHCGLLPNIMDLNPAVHMTPISRDFTLLLAQDMLEITERKHCLAPFENMDIQRVRERARVAGYKQPFQVNGFTATLYDAGHIPGSAGIYLEGEKKIFYTSDFNARETRLQRGCDEAIPEADILIIEGTYFGRNHPPREELEMQFIERIEHTVDRGGIALIPCFAIGRTQEILMLLHSHGLTPYLDGMGKEVCEYLLNHMEYLKEPDKFKTAFESAVPARPEKRADILSSPAIIVTTAGMLNGGPVLYYLSKLFSNPKNSLLLTGYQAEDTNGRAALEHGNLELEGAVVDLKMHVEYFDFSSHSGDAELKMTVEKFVENGVEKIFAVHSDSALSFTSWIEESFDIEAVAPKNGDEIWIE